MIGKKLAHFEITAKLGEGGMGTVWRAMDTTLDREVAIKVLPGAFSADPERLARFQREAKVLASLNHPNLAAVYSVHQHDGIRFIAQELVPGDDLATVLARGPMDVGQALRIAVQIAEGLEAAHRRGVVHRDLKPANVQLEPGGQAKILDFGLAKAAGTDPAGDPELSPTLTSPATQAGVVLGTAAYMSPEQARGQAVDQRADIWAFGVVLYEMLTGAGLFRGESVADTMVQVLRLEPDFHKLPDGTPPGVRRLLRRCLQKDPDQRLHHIADARIELQDSDLEEVDESAEVSVSRAPRGTTGLLAGGLLGALAGALLWAWLGSSAPSTDDAGPVPVRRSLIALPEGQPLSAADSVALSPDGSKLAVSAGLETSRLYLRRLDSDEMEPIPGTEGAVMPFFSPDGEELGFVDIGHVKKVSLRGDDRDISILCEAQVSYRGAWGSDGWIYFNFGESRLARVRAEGGEVQELGNVGDVFNMSPLPEGRGMLLTLHSTNRQSTRKDTSQIAVLSPDGQSLKPVLQGGYNARYLANGHLVFLRRGGLFAVPFDLERLEVTGPEVSVQPRVWTDSIWAFSHYATASDGTLVYHSSGDAARTALTWADLGTGEKERVPIPPGIYNSFDLSPNGERLAIQDLNGAQDQIWIYDFRRDTFSRLTLEGASFYPAWSHDGKEVFFASNRDGQVRLYRQSVDSSAPAMRLLTDEQEALMETSVRWPFSATPDGRYVAVGTWGHPERGGDLWKVPLDGASDPEVLLATEHNEIIPQVSPDGRWLTYLSDQKGDYQVMVRPFDRTDTREWNVSGPSGNDGRWTPGGDALIYWSNWWGTLTRTPVTTGEEFTVGTPRKLLDLQFHDAAGSSFAISPDGKRVLFQEPVEVDLWADAPLTLVTGWADEVARHVAAER